MSGGKLPKPEIDAAVRVDPLAVEAPTVIPVQADARNNAGANNRVVRKPAPGQVAT